jgi:hypothetical protein
MGRFINKSTLPIVNCCILLQKYNSIMSVPKVQGIVARNQVFHQQQMSSVFSKFNSRCDAIRKAPLQCVPDRVAYILSTRESATPEQAAAAERCCCPLCMQAIFDGSKAECRVCCVCSRRCCGICSQVHGEAVVCRSHTCAAVHKFMKNELSLEELPSECERISRDLLCQWLVLQSKREADLGPLRALYLIDARNAAMASMKAAAQFAQTAAPASSGNRAG